MMFCVQPRTNYLLESNKFVWFRVPQFTAKAGNEKEVEEYAQVFSEHARKLVEVLYN